MKRFIAVFALGTSLVLGGGAAAQQPGDAVINADGDSGTSNAGLIPAVDADGPTIVYGDLYPGPGTTVIGPAPETVPAITTETGAPVEADTDGDAVADDGEVNSYGTDPWSWDTDGDGLSDGEEIAAGTDPLDPASFPMVAKDFAASASGVDSDNDRLADADEAAFGTDPSNPDSGGDGYYDSDEVNLGTHPLDPTSFLTQ